MIYLIQGMYKQPRGYHYELRDENLEGLSLNSIEEKFELGEFVDVEKVGKSYEINKVNKPDNFLNYFYQGEYSPSELKEKLKIYIDKITNENYKVIIESLVMDDELFFYYPAAKTIHHAFIGGLALHTINMLEASESFIKLYDLNRDLLYTGIILHDLGKVVELENYGITYSVEGNLLGHIMIVYEQVVKVVTTLGINEDNDILYLKHLLLAHHGSCDFGSPKEPMIKEAFILHVLDDTDAKVNIIDNAIKDIEVGELSAPQIGFDRRRFLKIKK